METGCGRTCHGITRAARVFIVTGDGGINVGNIRSAERKLFGMRSRMRYILENDDIDAEAIAVRRETGASMDYVGTAQIVNVDVG